MSRAKTSCAYFCACLLEIWRVQSCLQSCAAKDQHIPVDLLGDRHHNQMSRCCRAATGARTDCRTGHQEHWKSVAPYRTAHLHTFSYRAAYVATPKLCRPDGSYVRHLHSDMSWREPAVGRSCRQWSSCAFFGPLLRTAPCARVQVDLLPASGSELYRLIISDGTYPSRTPTAESGLAPRCGRHRSRANLVCDSENGCRLPSPRKEAVSMRKGHRKARTWATRYVGVDSCQAVSETLRQQNEIHTPFTSAGTYLCYVRLSARTDAGKITPLQHGVRCASRLLPNRD